MDDRSVPRLRGVLAPVVTPFLPDLSPDCDRFVRHCRWLLDSGCSGLAVFATDGEANSLSVEERMMLLEELVHAGVPPAKLLPGTGCCSLTDTVRLTAHATAMGCAGVLVLPPFHYEDVVDEGLFRSFAEVIERVGDARLKVYLHHTPPVAQVGITLALVERLLARYPGTVAGIRDSSGDWSNTEALLANFRDAGFDVFAGSEVFLLRHMGGGGAGCITATGNVNPGAIGRLCRRWQESDAEALQAEVSGIRAIFQRFPTIAALKAAIARYASDPGWAVVRPPLVELTPGEAAELAARLDAAGFAMPGLGASGG